MFMTIWGITVLFLWFRPRIEIFWKIIATLIFLFTLWFFYKECMAGYKAMSAAWYPQLFLFLKELLSLVFLNLFLFWPLALTVIFYKADDIGAERMLKFMCLFTIIIWIIFVFYTFGEKSINHFIYDKLRDMVPFAK